MTFYVDEGNLKQASKAKQKFTSNIFKAAEVENETESTFNSKGIKSKPEIYIVHLNFARFLEFNVYLNQMPV